MTAIVMTPETVEWQGAISSLESVNSDGPFSIWPDHTRFVTIINDEPITVYFPDGSDKVFTYHEAVLVVDDNAVTIFIHMDE